MEENLFHHRHDDNFLTTKRDFFSFCHDFPPAQNPPAEDLRDLDLNTVRLLRSPLVSLQFLEEVDIVDENL